MNENSRIRHLPIRSRTASVDLKHLHYTLMVADHGSFRQAAEFLLVQQSTLSRHVRQLEQAIGVTIFERSSGGVRTTHAGHQFLLTARLIFEAIDSLVGDAYSAGRGEAGRLAVGFYTSLSEGNLRASLADFNSRFPKIEMRMVELSRTCLIAGLRTRALDIAVVTGDALMENNRSLSLWSERTLVALPKDHLLASRETVYWTDLRNEHLC